jgi:hypothetical protein
MVWLKGCRRCGGDLYSEKDEYGLYIACLQCGSVAADFSSELEASHDHHLPEPMPFRRRPTWQLTPASIS